MGSDVRRIYWWPRFPPSPLVRVLEIGSGAGDFARAAEARGWKVDTIEPATGGPTAEAWAATAPTQHYDAIFAWQVLEHLHDPALVARAVRRALKPGGYFVLSVPNLRSVERWVMGARWDGFAPDHLYYFTPSSLTRLLTRAGFTRTRVFYQRIVKHLHAPGWVTLLLGTLLAACRLSNRITVVARP